MPHERPDPDHAVRRAAPADPLAAAAAPARALRLGRPGGRPGRPAARPRRPPGERGGRRLAAVPGVRHEPAVQLRPGRDHALQGLLQLRHHRAEPAALRGGRLGGRRADRPRAGVGHRPARLDAGRLPGPLADRAPRRPGARPRGHHRPAEPAAPPRLGRGRAPGRLRQGVVRPLHLPCERPHPRGPHPRRARGRRPGRPAGAPDAARAGRRRPGDRRTAGDDRAGTAPPVAGGHPHRLRGPVRPRRRTGGRPGHGDPRRRPCAGPVLRQHGRLRRGVQGLHRALRRLPPGLPLLAAPADHQRAAPGRHRAPGHGLLPDPAPPDRRPAPAEAGEDGGLTSDRPPKPLGDPGRPPKPPARPARPFAARLRDRTPPRASVRSRPPGAGSVEDSPESWPGPPGAAPRYPARHVAVTVDSDGLATLGQ
ncbi:hypothetical protein SGPA1_60045 [Streptomyces misionensis JCM 4497]